MFFTLPLFTSHPALVSFGLLLGFQFWCLEVGVLKGSWCKWFRRGFERCFRFRSDARVLGRGGDRYQNSILIFRWVHIVLIAFIFFVDVGNLACFDIGSDRGIFRDVGRRFTCSRRVARLFTEAWFAMFALDAKRDFNRHG